MAADLILPMIEAVILGVVQRPSSASKMRSRSSRRFERGQVTVMALESIKIPRYIMMNVT